MKKLFTGLLFFFFLLLIAVILILCMFMATSHAQDLFDQAEIEFDIDYIDIDKVKVIGGTINGQVMAVWMKSGSVLTKTLSKLNSKFGDNDDREFDDGRDNLHSIYNYQDDESPDYLVSVGKSPDQLIVIANDIINSTSEWTYDYKWSTSHKEELDLLNILGKLRYIHNVKGPVSVKLAMDVITADLAHGTSRKKLYPEKENLLSFAQGDEQLTKMANDFLEENGFNEEKE